MPKEMNLRVIVYRDPESRHWIAQCLDHDIAAQAAHIKDLPLAFECSFVADAAWLAKNGRDIFENPIPPESGFEKMWEEAMGSPFRTSVDLKRARPLATADLALGSR